MPNFLGSAQSDVWSAVHAAPLPTLLRPAHQNLWRKATRTKAWLLFDESPIPPMLATAAVPVELVPAAR